MRNLLLSPRSLVLTNVDAALEICAVLDHDALSRDVTGKHRGLPELDPICA